MTLLDRSAAPKADDLHADKSSPAAINPLRVLFAVDSTFPGLGGAEIQAIKLAHALRDRGVKVEFVAPRLWAEQAVTETIDGFKLQRLRYPRIKYLGSIFLIANFARYLIVNRRRFDSVHIHITRLLSATAGAVRPVTGLPIVTKISGFYEFEGGVLDHRKRFLPVNFLTRLALRNVDFVQTISEQTRHKLLQAGFRDQQICFIPNGIDTRTPAASMPAGEVFTVGYCGRLREVKGVHILLSGFAKCLALQPNLYMQLHIAGNGETASQLLDLSRSLGIENAVTFLGRISDTGAFFAGLDVYVQPSFAEGLPNSVIEAMLLSRAVIATDIGGNTDLVEDRVSGYLFPPGNADKLAELLLQCYNNRRSLAQMGAVGRDVIVQRYGFDSVVDKLLQLYGVADGAS